MRFLTMAVASFRGNTPQHCRCIRQKTERAAEQDNSQDVQSAEGTPPLDGFVKGAAHQWSLREVRRKTDSAGSPEVLLPGSWNRVAKGANKSSEKADPGSEGRQFQIESRFRICPRRITFPFRYT